MRIALFIKSTTFHSGFGGLETQNKVLCEGLAARGHEVVVFSPKRELTTEEETSNNVVYKFVPCSYRALFGFSRFDKNNWVNKSVSSFLEQHDKTPFDIVVGQSSAAVGIIRMKHEIGVEIISISHGTILGEFKTAVQNLGSFKEMSNLIMDAGYVLYNFFGRQREFVLHSDKVIAVSKAVKTALVNETYIPEERVEVIYNGIKPFEFKQKQKESEDEVNLIYFGRIDKSKGLQVLLEVLSEPEFGNVKFTLIGEGNYLVALKNLSNKLELNDKVAFLGKLTHDQTIEKISGYDIFVLPSLRVEGFPMTVVEAMFAGLPTVVSNIGGLPEAVEEGKTGFIVPPEDKGLLKDRLLKLVMDSKLREQFGRDARKNAEKEFSLDVMLDKYEKVIKEVR